MLFFHSDDLVINGSSPATTKVAKLLDNDSVMTTVALAALSVAQHKDYVSSYWNTSSTAALQSHWRENFGYDSIQQPTYSNGSFPSVDAHDIKNYDWTKKWISR